MKTLGKKLTIALAITFAASSYLRAQTPAPVPSNFATAKTAFLANAGATAAFDDGKSATAIVYESMYKSLAAAGIYKLQSSPADTDLSMSVSVEQALTTMGRDTPESYTFIRLSIRDTKTQSLLWNIEEPITRASSEKTFMKNADDCTQRIIVDFKELTAGTIPNTPHVSGKSRMSQENEY